MQRRPTLKFSAYALIMTLVGSVFSLMLPAAQTSYGSHENITVNVSGDEVTETYDPGDSVVVEGIIDDVVDNEEITIRYKTPSGSTEETDDFGEPDSDGDFDSVFDIPNDADDGVWTVEVDYDNEQAYTYFIVDDEDDTIQVELDQANAIYEAGDEVTISGQVDEADDTEPDILITVLDPTNDEIVDEEEVELDGDEFEFSFDLDDDNPHGRYAVMVTYDIDDQEGSILFGIEDEEDGGSGGGGSSDECEGGDSDEDGDLSAELGADAYGQGDTVCMLGTIDGYDEADNIDLEIVLQDPEGEEVDDYGDSSANVESNGDFEYEFDLDDDADEGTYTVILTYDNDEVELEFEVEEGGGGTGGSGFTIRLSKTSLLAGETLTVSGTVEDVADPDEGEQLSVFIYRPEGQVILAAGSSKYLTPSSSGAYTATITIPSNLEADEDYTVIVSYLGDQVEASFDITGVSSTPSDEITVETDEDEYDVGSTVEISGEVPDSMIVEGEQLLLRVNKPDGNPCRIDPIEIPSSGAFSYELVLGGVCGVSGEYEVEVTYAGKKSETTFEVFGGATIYTLVGEGYSYDIEYEIRDGTIKSMFVRPNENKLVVTLDAAEDGQLTLVLPREVIDAIEEGEDIDFIVTIEDESGDVSAADVEEGENTGDERTLVINYEAGTGRIEIAGTQVIPEFGAIAVIVMAIAIIGIIVANSKYGNKFSLFRQ